MGFVQELVDAVAEFLNSRDRLADLCLAGVGGGEVVTIEQVVAYERARERVEQLLKGWDRDGRPDGASVQVAALRVQVEDLERELERVLGRKRERGSS